MAPRSGEDDRSGGGERDVDAHAPTEAVSDGVGTGPRSKRSTLARSSVGRFRIEGPLGSGGMGDVYRAHDSVLDRAVALKILRPDAGSEDDSQRRRRVVREARAAAALTHPNTVTVFDVGEDGDEIFIAMELLEGEDLRATLERGEASLSQKLRWLRQAASALAAAHGRGLVHRDVKPENMFVCRDGTLKLLDFGIAKRGEDDEARPERPADDLAVESLGPSSFKTAVGRRFGTPRYMAPEQHAGEATDPRTDQYAWGLVAFELLTGALSIDALPTRTSEGDLTADAGQITTARFAELRARVPELPEAVARIVQRSLEPRKDARYPSMKEIVEALDAIDLPDSRRAKEIADAPDAKSAPGAPSPTATTAPIETDGAPPTRKRLRLGVGLAAAAVVLAGAGLGARAMRARTPPMCRLVAAREVALAEEDRAGLRADGTLIIARAAGNGPVRLEQEGPGGTVPSPLPMILDGMAKVPHVDMEIGGAFLDGVPSTAAIFYQDGTRGLGMDVFVAVWNEQTNFGQRILGPVSGLATGTFRGSLIVAVTTHGGSPRARDLPTSTEIYRLSGSRPRIVVELSTGEFPSIATSDDRIVLAYSAPGGTHFAALDPELLRVGDIAVIGGVDAAPAVAFDGRNASVYWSEENAGRNRLMVSTIVLGQSKFTPPRVAIDEPVARGRPTVVPLTGNRNALAWVTSAGGTSTLRFSPIGADGSLIGPSDLATAPNVKGLVPIPAPREPTTLAWRQDNGRVHVGDVTCTPAAR